MNSAGRRGGGILAIVALCGCQGAPFPQGSPLHILKVTTTQTLRIPAGSARASYQLGAQVRHRDIYETHCEFEISTVSDMPQVVEADEFVVVSGSAAVLAEPDARLPAGAAFSPSACIEPVYYEVRYRLGSTRQPRVRQLRCLRAFPACWRDQGYPTPEAIQQALGNAFLIE